MQPAKIAQPEQPLDGSPDRASATPEQNQRPPTVKQLAVLRFIYEHSRIHGYPPTLRDIGRERGITSTNGVSDHLKALSRKGFIVKESMLTRAIRITPAGYALLGVPELSLSIPTMAPRLAPPPPPSAPGEVWLVVKAGHDWACRAFRSHSEAVSRGYVDGMIFGPYRRVAK